MPRSYLPVYLAIKLPLALWAGSLLALAFAALPQWPGQRQQAWMRGEVGFVAFVILFPILLQIALHSPIFSGMRHFLFVVPPLAVLAGIGWHGLIATFQHRSRPLAAGVAGGLAALLAWNGSILVRLHPHEYLFYNALVGGLQGANGRFATDYWVNSMPEAVRGLETFLARTEPHAAAPQPHSVGICAERLQFEKVAGDRLYWTDDWDAAEFFISPTHMNCDRVVKGDVVATVERLGVVIAVVKDRRAILAKTKAAGS
jgi:hypothetical protein